MLLEHLSKTVLSKQEFIKIMLSKKFECTAFYVQNIRRTFIVG